VDWFGDVALIGPTGYTVRSTKKVREKNYSKKGIEENANTRIKFLVVFINSGAFLNTRFT
jgi:hypothetical protein